MHIILTVLQTLLIIITLLVIIGHVLRRYELGNRETGAPTGPAGAATMERALGIAGEIAAVFLAILAYPLGYIIGESSVAELRSGEPPIILCHGYMHNRSAFLVLEHRIRKAGWNNIIAPNFRPASASIRCFADQLSEKVRQAISQTGCDRVNLIGHSMGGLVMRYFIEHLGGSSSVRTAITLGTPHRGTKTAVLGLFDTARQFRPDSTLIAELRLPPSAHDNLNMVSIWSDFDTVVLPPENASLPEPGKNIVVRNVGHVALLFSGQVFTHLRRELTGDPAT